MNERIENCPDCNNNLNFDYKLDNFLLKFENKHITYANCNKCYHSFTYNSNSKMNFIHFYCNYNPEVMIIYNKIEICYYLEENDGMPDQIIIDNKFDKITSKLIIDLIENQVFQ